MPRTVVVNIAERVGATFLHVFLAALIAAGALNAVQTHGHVPWLGALDQGGFAAAVSLVTSLIAVAVGLHSANRYLDLVYRVLATFGQSLLATFATAGTAHSLIHFGWSAACYVAMVAAGLALVKGLIGLWTAAPGAAVFPAPAAVPAAVAPAQPAAPPAA